MRLIIIVITIMNGGAGTCIESKSRHDGSGAGRSREGFGVLPFIVLYVYKCTYVYVRVSFRGRRENITRKSRS